LDDRKTISNSVSQLMERVGPVNEEEEKKKKRTKETP